MTDPPTSVEVIMKEYPKLKPSKNGEQLDFMVSNDPQFDRLKEYARNLPYPIESNADMQELLDFILKRMVQCLKAKSYDPGFLQWDSMLNYWKLLKYPIPKNKRIALVKLYYELCVTPGMLIPFVGNCLDTLLWLVRSKKKLSLNDLRLPWRPVYTVIRNELFLSRRQYEISALPNYMGSLAEACQRFFHPACIEEVLEEIVPTINGTSLDILLSTQYYLLTFLPLTHPQIYLPALFRLWEPVNSAMYSSRMIAFLAKLAEMHVDPTISDPARIQSIPDDAKRRGEVRVHWDNSDLKTFGSWRGIWKDVGIFTDEQWSKIMCYTLSSMEISLADSGSLSTEGISDLQSGFEIDRLPSPPNRIRSLATIIVYSMHEDSPIAPPSGMATPFAPEPAESPFHPGSIPLQTTFIAGSKALDCLIKLIVSTENFFHPSNSGPWTSNLSSFVRSIAFEFNKRWYEEQSSNCRTPPEGRLTHAMRRELVKCLRTVTLLGVFSTDGSVVSDILSCLKSMTIMEPGMLLPSIIERAVPSLEGLTETRRTTAMIRALTAVGVALVSRDIYYPGAKNLMPILDLLVPGIDPNDSNKTLCTAILLFEVSHAIKFGDLTYAIHGEQGVVDDFTAPMSPHIANSKLSIPDIKLNGTASNSVGGMEVDANGTQPTREEEDDLLRQSTTGFADWIATFFRRVIGLLESLPEDMPGDSASSVNDTDASVIDVVLELCEQICIHLSEPLFDLVLTLIYDYATTTVRSNATRCMHALVKCVAAANPVKTLAKFVPYCVRCIQYELAHGASNVRTTSSSSPVSSDAALHWNIALLRGAVSCGHILAYQEPLLDILKLLHQKALSKRGFTLTGKLLKKMLTELTGTFTDFHRFVNPDVWNDPSFKESHHKYWGKLMASKDAQIEWHVPDAEEIEFALRIFAEIVDPAMVRVSNLLAEPNFQDLVWRNDYCRHISIINYAFSGVPQLVQELRDPQTLQHMYDTSDLADEIHEFIATLEPIESGFSLHDPKDPRWIDMTQRKHQFAELLRDASRILRSNGSESALDPVYLTIQSIRTIMAVYGDSRQSYFSLLDQYVNEKNMVRRYARQKVWSRNTLATRAYLYHTARLRWNSIDRVRDVLKDQLIVELAEWSVSGFASVRATSQSTLSEMISTYDGARRLVQPLLLQSLARGTDDDRMKGALYTLNLSVFVRSIMTEPTTLPEFARVLLECQHNEKASIQVCVSDLVENCLAPLLEPSTFLYQLEHPELESATSNLEHLLAPMTTFDLEVIHRGARWSQNRVRRSDEAFDRLTSIILEKANSPDIHWRYAIGCVRFLRTLIRRDKPISPAHLEYFLRKVNDNHHKIRYYAQRGVMKALRNFKHRSLCPDIYTLASGRSSNPLKRSVVIKANRNFTINYFRSFKGQVSWEEASNYPLLQDKPASGWVAWSHAIDLYLAPSRDRSPFLPWKSDPETVTILRSIVGHKEYWIKMKNFFCEENGSNSVSYDNIACVKSIFQVLEDEFLSILKPLIEELLGVIDQNKQRAAADMIAGVIGGSKHWNFASQERLWSWISSLLPRMLGNNVRTDSLRIWTTFLEYVVGHKDPRRYQPLLDYLLSDFMQTDFNSDSFFQPLKITSFINAVGDQLKWRFLPWIDDVLQRYWLEIGCDHEEIRTNISEMLELSVKIKSSPQPSKPTAEAFVRQCRAASSSDDIMGIRKAPEAARVQELAKDFPIWRRERLPGVKVLQSTYDKVGNMLCKWLLLLLNDVPAVTFFDVVLPLMPELFRFCELHDNEELVKRAGGLLTRMCAFAPPQGLLDVVLDRIFDAIQNSTSWRVRLKALPLLQIWHFRQFPIISDEKLTLMLEVCCDCLDDEIIEVREMAATTLSGILRCSPRRSILQLKTRFVKIVESIQLPSRQNREYALMLRKLHGGILGICALIDSFPYTVEKWTPELLTDVLNQHTYDPVPVSTTVRACAANFKKTHQDTWHEDQGRFTDEQLSALSTLLTGSSYYA